MPASPQSKFGLLPEDLAAGSDASSTQALLAALRNGSAAPIPAPGDFVAVEEDADIRALDRSLARMMHRASELLAKSHLYFSDKNLRELASMADAATTVADEIDLRARGMLLRSEVPHAQKYMTWTNYLRAAVRAAGRAAQLFDLLQQERALPALSPLKRIAEAAQRVLLYAAATLETADAQQLTHLARHSVELAEACSRAETLLVRSRALLPLPAERMTRAAIWSMFITAECAATVACQYQDLLTERRVRDAHRAHAVSRQATPAGAPAHRGAPGHESRRHVFVFGSGARALSAPHQPDPAGAPRSAPPCGANAPPPQYAPAGEGGRRQGPAQPRRSRAAFFQVIGAASPPGLFLVQYA